MTNRTQLVSFATLLALVSAAGLWPAAIASEAQDPPVSQYAPAEDLIALVQDSAEEIHKTLSDGAAFDEQSEARNQAAGVLAAASLALAWHDEESPWNQRAAGLYAAAVALLSAESFDEAQTADSQLQNSLSSDAATETELPEDWENPASLHDLMERVGQINTRLRRGITRLDRRPEVNRQNAVALAVIAQVAATDHSWVEDEEQEKIWTALSIQMRDAAGQLNQAVRNTDEQAAALAMERLEQSCTKCHEAFRVEAD